MKNNIFLCGKVCDEMVSTFLDSFTKLKQSKDTLVNIFITSEGGDPYDAIGIYDILKESPIQSTAICVGQAYSSASIILLGCKKRLATPNSKIMIHNATIDLGDITEYDMITELNEFKNVNKIIRQIIIKNTTIPKSEFTKMFEKNQSLYFNTTKALKYKFIHGIYRKI